MLPRSDKTKRIHPDCPRELARYVDVTLATSLSKQPIYAGEKLEALVKRNCPAIFDEVKAQGFELRFDMPENTHKALTKGRLFYQIRRPPLH